MYRTTTVLVLLALASLPSGGARADVVYNWVNLEPNAQGLSLSATLTINNAYWSAGGDLQNGSGLPPIGHSPEYTPYFGADLFQATFIGGDTAAGPDPFDINDVGPISCGNYCTNQASAFGNSGFGGQQFALNFGTLTGSIHAFDVQDGILMVGSADTWTVLSAVSDGDNRCYVANCGGEVGYWALDRASVPTPEPATLALLGLGVAGGGLSRRNRNKRDS